MLYKSDVGVWILAHRSVATYPKEIFLENFHKEDPTLTEYCKLVAHYGSDKYTAPELMKEALVCVFLTRCLQATGYFGIQEKIEPVFGVEGGFQLESLSINRVINHMTCYKSECSH